MSVLQNLSTMASNMPETPETKNLCYRFIRKKYVCLLFFMAVIILTFESLIMFGPLLNVFMNKMNQTIATEEEEEKPNCTCTENKVD